MRFGKGKARGSEFGEQRDSREDCQSNREEPCSLSVVKLALRVVPTEADHSCFHRYESYLLIDNEYQPPSFPEIIKTASPVFSFITYYIPT